MLYLVLFTTYIMTTVNQLWSETIQCANLLGQLTVKKNKPTIVHLMIIYGADKEYGHNISSKYVPNVYYFNKKPGTETNV
jgi:hypothetical protein